MKRYKMLTVIIVALFALAGGLYALKSSASWSNTQPVQPSGAPPPGGPMGGPPGGPGMSAEFQKTHKYALQLMKLVNNIGRLEESKKAPLTAKQAKYVLSVLEPLRKAKSLNEPAAKKAIKKLQAVLTDKQRSAITALPVEPKFRQGGPPPGGPGGPPPGGPRPGAPGPQQSMKNFNPLNPPATGPANKQHPGGIDKLMQDLKKRSVK